MTTVTSPTDLLAAVPFLIGYQPSDAIVLMTLVDESITMALRIDFPNHLKSEQLESLVQKLQNEASDAILMVSYIPDEIEEADEVIKSITLAIERAGIPLRESIIVLAGRWRSLVCSDSNCCPIEGSPLPILQDSRIASEEISNGKPMPFDDLGSMSKSLSPLEEDQVLLEMIGRILPIDYESDPIPEQRSGAEAVVDFLHDFAIDGICKDKRLIAKLLVRLRDLQVRDYALGTVSEEDSDLHYCAWRWLMRRAPIGYVAAPAVIFAAICYERGDGALANLALERAKLDQPDYPMARLLSQVFRSGQPPTLFRELRAELHPQVCTALFSGNMAM
jgi:hypothetical protein